MDHIAAALDLGTTSVRAIIYREGTAVASASRDVAISYPQPGYVEQDAMRIYGDAVSALRDAIKAAGISASDVACIGIANQRETTVVWDRRTGAPVCETIVWQDRRSADIADDIAQSDLCGYIRGRTGLSPDAYFSVTKLLWIMNHIAGVRERARRGELCFGTIDSFMIWHMTGQHKTDVTNASRTMMYNIHALSWDARLLDAWDIPHDMLPEVVDSAGLFGHMYLDDACIPVTGAVGDQQAALLGQGCVRAGDAKHTYGTGCFLLRHTGDTPVTSQSGLLTTIALGVRGGATYALEGSVFVGGALVQWLRDIGMIEGSRDIGRIAATVPDTGGVCVVPAFAGLGAPYWDSDARGVITGLTRGTTRAHILRAAEEAICHQTQDLIDACAADCGCGGGVLRVDGGATADDFLMQLQSDISGISIQRPLDVETTARGAYNAALIGAGYADLADITPPLRDKVFAPAISDASRADLRDLWHKAVDKCRHG